MGRAIIAEISSGKICVGPSVIRTTKPRCCRITRRLRIIPCRDVGYWHDSKNIGSAITSSAILGYNRLAERFDATPDHDPIPVLCRSASAYRDPSKSKAAAAVSWHEVAHDASSSRCGILAPYGSEHQGYLGHRQFHQRSDAQQRRNPRGISRPDPRRAQAEQHPAGLIANSSRARRALEMVSVSHHSATRVAKLAPSASRGDQERGETS